MLGPRDGGYHEVNTLKDKLEVFKVGVVDYGYLTVIAGFKFWVCLITN